MGHLLDLAVIAAARESVRYPKLEHILHLDIVAN